ncbi:pentatricopeptide repeat-containing protein At5g15280, mitochondrial [Phoenix dactylifera]|uniref:Pentatricopeptide repeat-containing protein At5g15280, mitochondrial n=1 Tax=Phoenix dactylifera TaxID=42345 RepID=A0A8B7CTC8_PHODC|nr:pentatricopeptide repeat-containing protein At5g15280, mitochondrial [Phoenix dactylifera]XP_026664982.1 pentatricopeptide repeat-containing protein At5g15280, mitochondrial [Phoenix dactylifera]
MVKKLRASFIHNLLQNLSSSSDLLRPSFPYPVFPLKGRTFGLENHSIPFPLLAGRAIPFSGASIPCSAEKSGSISASGDEIRGEDHVNFASKSFFGVGKSVISRCSFIWETKVDTLMEKTSLQDLLKLYGNLSPETTRRFWRVSALKPEGFLEILLGFGPDVNLDKVGFLWKLFRWAEKQSREFKHLPRSYEIMIPMLIQARMLGDAESLLLSPDARGVCSDESGVFSEIIQGYAEACKLENSMALYDRARDMGLVPSASCYHALLNLLIRMEKSESVVRVYKNMIDVGFGSHSDDRVLDFVIGELTKNGQILEAISILKQVNGSGTEASPMALSAIAEGFCKKKDFSDMIKFLEEREHIPENCICNKIISSVCSNLGTEEAWLFVQRLEALGFKADAVTFGIFICQSCREKKLRNAFVYLSECFSRGLKPSAYAYHALISGIFKQGLCKHAKYVFEDMLEKGLLSDLSTFRILLAGYCIHRKFDEVKQVIDEMNNHGIVSLAPSDDALSKTFKILGLDNLNVKVKRDNDLGLAKAEFFDSLGNGLYLETDIDEYDKSLTQILDSAMIPDFDSALIKECRRGNVEGALKVREEAVQWGQNLSVSGYFELLKTLCASPTHIEEAVSLTDEMPDSCDQLGCEALNLLKWALLKKGMTSDVKLILERLFRRGLLVDNDVYTALIMGFSKEGEINKLQHFWELAQRGMWLPEFKDTKVLVSFLCRWGLIKEVLELFDKMVENYPNLIRAIYSAFLKELCISGYTSVGCTLLEELLQRDLVFDQAVYVNLINGFLKEQNFAETLGIFDILLEKNITASAHVYQLIVPLLIRFGSVEKVMNLKQSLLSKKQQARVSIFGTMVSELCRTGKIKEATLQLQEMLINGILPDGNTLNALLQGYCQENNLRKAREILSVMVRTHINLSISGYRSLVRQMCAHGHLHGALSAKKLNLGKNPWELILCNILIFRLFQTGNSLLVESLLRNMHDKHINPDKNTYDFLVYGFLKCGDASTSVEALNTMIAKGLRPSNRSLRTIICHLCSNGKVDKALELSKEMECNVWKHGSVVQNVLAGRLLSCGRLCEAELLLDRMKQKDLIPNNIHYDLLIKQFCVHGGIKKAIDLLNVMLKKGNLPSDISYSSVIHRLCNCKAFDHALDFHAEMQYKNLAASEESSEALIFGLCAIGRTDDAKGILGKMLQYGSIPTYSMYNHVINRYYANNDLEKASEVLHEMQQAGYSPNFETHWSLISNLSSCSSNKDDNGKGFLARLLSGSSLPVKNCKDKGSSAFKYTSIVSYVL